MGYWYSNGVKSEHVCDGKEKDNDCGMNQLSEYHRTCILGPPNNTTRCWWIYVPDSVKQMDPDSTVPLFVDMHGGGGCAQGQESTSGFRALSEVEGFIIAWP